MNAIRHRGYYVCLEECGQWFGNTYLRDVQDNNDETSTTPYLDNATYWPTSELAEFAYRKWVKENKSKLAEAHRKMIDIAPSVA